MPVYSLYRTQKEGKHFSTGGLFQGTLLQELLRSHYFVQRIQILKSFVVYFGFFFFFTAQDVKRNKITKVVLTWTKIS